MKLSRIDILVYFAYLAFFGLGLLASQRTTLSSVALVLSVVCLALWIVARWQLGDAFSVGAEAHRLVTYGLYSRIRHPIYVFGTMAFLFIVLALQGWFALFIWAIVILIQVRRARLEEHLLMDIFGEEYTAYRKQTWF
jgi:protein-S-isoprenylcysteine O-methyltransferase Ste14